MGLDELSKREIREIVKDGVKEAMAEKLEITFGIDCRSPDDRQEARKDMEFVRKLRTGDSDVSKNMEFVSALLDYRAKIGQKLLLIAVGVCGTGALYYVISWLWPEGFEKYFRH
jgi:hypothetical protein